MSDLIRLTGLWKSQSKAGAPILSGSISPTSKLVIVPNTYKKKDSEPDYIAFMAPYEKQEKQADD